MINRINTPEDLPPILLIKDDIEQHIDYDRSSWLQWLVENCKNPLIGIFADIENNDTEANGYAVALNAISPPFTQSVVVMYIFTNGDTHQLIDAIKAWAEAVGANRVEMQTGDSDSVAEFGFVKTSSVVGIEI